MDMKNLKVITALLICVLVTFSLAVCTSAKKSKTADYSVYTDFEGKKIGVPSGNLAEKVILDDIKGTPVFYPGIYAALADIRSGGIDGFITDLSTVRVLAGASENADLKVIPVPAEIFSGALGAFSSEHGSEQGIIDHFNAFLGELKAGGTLAELQSRWLETVPNAGTPMPDIALSGENGTLKIVTTGNATPFSFVGADGELKGYSIELALRFAQREGMNVEFVTVDFNRLIPAVQNGEAGFGIDAVTINEERAKLVTFSDSIYDDSLGIITLK